MDLLQNLKEEIVALIQDITGVAIDQKTIEVPPKPEMGDLAVPMFSLTKTLKKSPQDIAKELAEQISSDSFSNVVATGPYLNFFMNQSEIASQLIPQILKEKGKVSEHDGLKGKKVMVEYFSPNTNKAMTVGHLRNVILGATIVRLLKKSGAKVIQSCLYNDRGIAVSKSMVAYEKFGEGATPESTGIKPDQFVGNFYVKFGQETKKDEEGNDDKTDPLMVEATASLKAWEEGDKATIKLWKLMNSWVYAGYKATLGKLKEGNFDEVYFESDFWDKGKDVVMAAIGKGLIKQADDGAVYADLESQNLGKKFLLRANGSTLYSTQDIVLAGMKAKSKPDLSIWVVANEQDYYLQQMFAILKSLGDEGTQNYHLSYGMMRLPDGKIKSRQGSQKAMADALIAELESLAKAEVSQRQPELSEVQLDVLANKIMNAALKFYILSVSPASTMIFEPQKAISFTGKTGPYLQYTAVRLNSILVDVKLPKKIAYDLLTNEIEKQLVNKLNAYQQVVSDALDQYNPLTLVTYLHELAQLANTFYVQVPVLKAEDGVKNARLALIKAISTVLTDGLGICGIEVPEKM